MFIRTAVTLPDAITLIAPVHGTSTVLACTARECFEVDIAPSSGRVEQFARFGSNSFATGGGGWADHIFIAEHNGAIHERRRDAHSIVRPSDGEIRACAVARDARRMVCSVPYSVPQGFMPSDVIVVFDVTNGCGDGCERILRYEPPSGDTFEIEQIAISADGRWAGLTGYEMIYGVDYSPTSTVNERACIVRCTTANDANDDDDATAVVLEIENTWRTDIVGRAIALGSESWFVDRYVIPAAAAAAAAALAAEKQKDVEDYVARLGAIEPTIVAALSGGGFAVVGGRSFARQPQMKATRLVVGHPEEPPETDTTLDFDAGVTAMIALEGTIVIGHDDGRIVCVERSER